MTLYQLRYIGNKTDITGLDLKDIILAKRQEPVKKVGKWTVYDVQGHMIALELLNESEKKDEKKSA